MRKQCSRNERRNRDYKHKKKLENLYKINDWKVRKFDPENNDFHCTRDITKVYYQRLYWKGGTKKWLRRQSNKVIRNATFDEIPQRGNGYKKKYDLWWKLI